MVYEEELLTQFHTFCWNAQTLALKSVHDIELPLCGYLIGLNSSDCIKLIKNNSSGWSKLNQPSVEKILLNYLITDYVSCGLSSPTFYTVFHTTLQSNKSKTQFLKDLITIWDCLFKTYEITSLNVDFIKHFVVSLESLFLKISNTDDCFKFQSIQVISKIKFNIKMFEQKIQNCQVLHTLSDYNIKVHNSNKEKILGLENIVQSKSKINLSIPSLSSQIKQTELHMNNLTTLHTDQEKSLDSNLPKNQTFISNDVENLPIKRTKPGIDSNIVQPEQKLNAFQIMMFNAKKRKANPK